MQVTDSRTPGGPGFCPMQHVKYEDQGFDLDMRTFWAGVRIVSRDIAAGELGHYQIEEGSVGDITGGFLFKNDSEPKRPIPSWRFSPWPVVRDAAFGSQSTNWRPVRWDKKEVEQGNVLTPDKRFAAEDGLTPVEENKPCWPKFPEGFRGILVQTSNEEKQYGAFLPTDPRIICPAKAGDPATATIVCDEKAPDKIDKDRQAGVDSFWRVLKAPRGSGNALAWTLTPSLGAGAGYVYDKASEVGSPGFTGAVTPGGTIKAEIPAPTIMGLPANSGKVSF